MQRIYDPDLDREVMGEIMTKTFDGGAVKIAILCYPEKLVTEQDSDDLLRQQAEACRQFADKVDEIRARCRAGAYRMTKGGSG